MEKQIRLIKKIVDSGYPDPGHQEYFLVRTRERKNKFWQKLLGDKQDVLMAYGEDKPSDEEINTDTLKYRL